MPPTRRSTAAATAAVAGADGSSTATAAGVIGGSGGKRRAPTPHEPSDLANHVPAQDEEELAQPSSFVEMMQRRVRDRMRFRHSCLEMEAQRNALMGMMHDLRKGDSNSALLLGPSGAGKSAVSVAVQFMYTPARA